MQNVFEKEILLRMSHFAVVLMCIFYGLISVLADEPASKKDASKSTVSVIRGEDPHSAWELEFHRRLAWWSLQPLANPTVPVPQTTAWCENDVDRFVLAQLESRGIRPSALADRATLVRRLSFALTGLPPSLELLQMSCGDGASLDYEGIVAHLMNSPQFGERWARHWMDVVHYADTHGYEWDVPAKEAWRYRDYLIRAFNDDVPYKQLVLEQIAGDMLPPRINATLGINEALIGPMMLRLGERRHGDNSAAEGVTQEAISNSIDTIGKAFLATTLACAQCHDHKLDAVEQRDYYSLAGMLMSTRFSTRSIDAVDPNQSTLLELSQLKLRIQEDLAKIWLTVTSQEDDAPSLQKLRGQKSEGKSPASFPSSLMEFYSRSLTQPLTPQDFENERAKRLEANRNNLTLLADFSKPEFAAGWRWEGFGMQHGLVGDGALVVSDQSDVVLLHLLPAGRYSHVWSSRLAGLLQSPELASPEPMTFSIEGVAGKFASQSFIVDRALNPERLQFPKRPFPQWQTLVAGNFDSLEGTVDTAPRRVYFELATKSFNNYFPPRVGYGGVSEAEVADPRSWFGVTRVYQHAPGKGPQDELTRFVPLFDAFGDEPDWGRRLVRLLHAAVHRWASGNCNGSDVELINDGIRSKLLPNVFSDLDQLDATIKSKQFSECKSQLCQNLEKYRQIEKNIQPDRTVGSAADWDEGKDERIGIRGSYSDLGESVSRGHIRFMAKHGFERPRSGSRLDFALGLTDNCETQLARVYVNRVWHYLFGAGLVRSTDDFGYLGESPSHPELLDFLAHQFIQEGWSTKKLIHRLVTSAVWKQANIADSRAAEADPENRLWHHRPIQRLEAEAIRDAMLFASGRLDRTLYGPPIEPYRTAGDSQKRLFQGPLDGNGRRSMYLEMTLMEPPRFLALFNQPIPKLTVGRRDKTNVPDQALALLNDPFVHEVCRVWSERLIQDSSPSIDDRVRHMIRLAFSRDGDDEELAEWNRFIQKSAATRGVTTDVMKCAAVWQDVAHVLVNMKEFIYVR